MYYIIINHGKAEHKSYGGKNMLREYSFPLMNTQKIGLCPIKLKHGQTSECREIQENTTLKVFQNLKKNIAHIGQSFHK